MEKTLYQFEVEVLRAGQARPYANHVYEAIVKNLCRYAYVPRVIEGFCCKWLKPAYPETERGKHGWWEPFYTFEVIDERTFRYIVTEEYTD